MSLHADFVAPVAATGLTDAELQKLIARGRLLHARAAKSYFAEIGTLLAALFRPARAPATAPRHHLRSAT